MGTFLMIVGMGSSRLRDKRGGCQSPRQRKFLLEFKHSNEKNLLKGSPSIWSCPRPGG